MWCRPICNEKLRTIGIASRVRHRQNASIIMSQGQRTRLIIEFIAGTTPTSASRIATLSHKASNDTMEGRIIIEALTSQKHEIIHRNGGLGRKQLDFNIAFDRMEDCGIFLPR